jgi:hypothetical protein
MAPPSLRARALAGLLTAPLLLACGGGDGGADQGSRLAISFAADAPGASTDVIFLRERAASGGLLVLDVVGRELTPPVDGLDLVIAFDPGIASAFGVMGETFLGTCGRPRPDNSLLVCQDNVGGGANPTGLLMFSAHPADPSPTPERVSGDRVLATISLRAAGPGVSSVEFHVPARPAPGIGSFSQVTSAGDPAGAAAVGFHPDAPGRAEIRVTRAR